MRVLTLMTSSQGASVRDAAAFRVEARASRPVWADPAGAAVRAFVRGGTFFSPTRVVIDARGAVRLVQPDSRLQGVAATVEQLVRELEQAQP